MSEAGQEADICEFESDSPVPVPRPGGATLTSSISNSPEGSSGGREAVPADAMPGSATNQAGAEAPKSSPGRRATILALSLISMGSDALRQGLAALLRALRSGLQDLLGPRGATALVSTLRQRLPALRQLLLRALAPFWVVHDAAARLAAPLGGGALTGTAVLSVELLFGLVRFSSDLRVEIGRQTQDFEPGEAHAQPQPSNLIAPQEAPAGLARVLTPRLCSSEDGHPTPRYGLDAVEEDAGLAAGINRSSASSLPLPGERRALTAAYPTKHAYLAAAHLSRSALIGLDGPFMAAAAAAAPYRSSLTLSTNGQPGDDPDAALSTCLGSPADRRAGPRRRARTLAGDPGSRALGALSPADLNAAGGSSLDAAHHQDREPLSSSAASAGSPMPLWSRAAKLGASKDPAECKENLSMGPGLP